MLEENDYHDDENEVRDPVIDLKQQKYATWLYVLLLFISLYILFYLTLMTSHSQTITVSPITLNRFKQLYFDYAETLSCPCSTISVPHKEFISNNITFHPICSSIFVSKEWIQALYLINASDYGRGDFRVTAKSQFQLLADLCSMSKDTVSQTEEDFDNDEFITINLLHQEQVQSEVNVSMNTIKSSISTQMISFLNYIRVYVRTNFIASALNTNLMFSTYVPYVQYQITQYIIYQLQAQYTPDMSIYSTSVDTMMCGSRNPITPTGFFPERNTTKVFELAGWADPEPNSTLVKGFFTACTSLEALLPSTLDCLYNIKCIHLLINYFPSLNQLNFNWTNSTLPSKQSNITVYDHFLDLFIENWSTEVNYSKYFNECASLSCFQNIHPKKFVKSLKRLNLFKNIEKLSEEDIKHQRMITRVYLFLLAGSFLILLLFTSLETEVVTITESNPSLTTYNYLQKSYSNTLRCPCSITTIPHEELLTLSPTLHQICSSDFITDQWLIILQQAIDYNAEDWRNRAYSQFQLLSNLCKLAKNTIDNAVQRFLFQSLFVSSILSQSEFNTQINTTLDQFFQSTIRSFGSLINITSLLTQVDQFYMGARKTEWDTIQDNFLIPNIPTNNQSLQIIFNSFGTRYVNLSSVNCICATNSACQTPVAIYEMDNIWNTRIYAYIIYIVPGAIGSCSTFSSLMFSQLLCFYSNIDCFPILMNYVKASYYQNVENPVWFDPRPLVYNAKLSRFPPNTSVSRIVEQIMIEQWNPSYSYERFYDLCAPNYCTYSEKMRARSIIEVIITFISMIGGLAFALILITPLFITFISSFLQICIKRRQQQLVHQGNVNQWKTTAQNFISMGYITLINVNIFSTRDFGSNINRNTAKHLGTWATRLHIILFITGLIVLTFYTIFVPQTNTKTFNKPSYNLYNSLKQEYGDQLKCSCSVIASKYNQFTQIEPIFHQICTSSFISDQWRTDVTSRLDGNLSSYGQRDYRRFLSAHLQYLQGLCQISIQSIDNSIEQFLTSLFVTTELLSNDDFQTRLNFLIQQKKSAASIAFTHPFFLMRSINHENAYISTYGTNYEYISSWFWTTTYFPYVPNKAVIYDNNCSCGMYSNCITQANFIEQNASIMVEVKGLKMGCTPSESLRLSTLECFYDQSCINLIKLYSNSINSYNFSIPLSITMSRYSMNTIVAELMNELFVEQWVSSINYSSYYEQCLPLSCTYTYNEQFNILYLVTVLIGLQGGLTIVLRWICPKLVRIIAKLHETRKKRTNNVQPNSFVQSKNAQISSIRINNSDYNMATVPNVTSERVTELLGQRRLKIVFICLVLLMIVTGLIVFSIYTIQQRKNNAISTTFTSTMTVNVTTTTIIMSTTTAITTTTAHGKYMKFVENVFLR
ncbi:hypothetical protein I4U23_031383 [Adineta vaga]|nr:hypothetical protein I4U23_031383 [Adineta vaga]